MGRHSRITRSKVRRPGAKGPRKGARSEKNTIGRLKRELAEAREQQTATAEVLKVISSSTFDLQIVFEAMAKNAVKLCDAERGYIFRFDGNLLRAVASYNVGPENWQFVHRNPIAPGRHSISARAALERRTVHVKDIQNDPEYAYVIRDVEPIRTVLSVPMLKGDELVGTITIYRIEVKPFTAKQIELVQNFAAQAVIAIENTRLLTELRHRTDDLSESLDQQTATSDVLAVISRSSGDLIPVFTSILDNAILICEAKFGGLFLKEDPGFRSVAQQGPLLGWWQKDPVVDVRLHPGLPLSRVGVHKAVVHITDLAADVAFHADDARFVDLVETAGARTVLGVPMLKQDDLVGAIIIYRSEARPFTDKQIELVKNFASQAVIAIENTRLLNELRESLQQQTATADVLKVISRSAFDLDPVLDSIVETASRLCEAEFAVIFKLQDGMYHIAASNNADEAFLKYASAHPISPSRGSLIGRAALEGKTVHLADCLADPEYTYFDYQNAGKYRSDLGVPLLREGVPIGVIALMRKEVRPFSDKQIELVETFADQAVIAIENVRLFEEVQKRTEELAASLDNLRATQDRLVQTQKLASLGQLTAGIAHEMKNPLNFVNNFSVLSAEMIDELRDTLKELSFDETTRAQIGELTGTLRENLGKVVQHGKRADAIVKNMLLHSRESSAEQRLVDINALVDESLNLAYHGARAEGQGFSVNLERSLDPVAGEANVFPRDITRALLNLISNGFYAATKRKAQANNDSYKPTLGASTKSLGERVEIRIRDNGTGIPPELKEKIFDPFFTTKPAGEGTGLGLSLSHDIIVKQHGGSIEIDTQVNEFTEVKIILPRTLR